jgi:hypothetical protein
MSVSLSEVLAGAEAQAVPLSAECAGYLVLAAADQAALSPRRVQPGEVCLLDDGAVRLLGGMPADDATAERDLRELLGGLLSSASSTTAGLVRARRRAPGAGVGALLRELERALIPVNRSAARRALARLARETVRAKDEGRLTVVPAAPPPVEPVAPTVVAPPPVRESELFAESLPAPSVDAPAVTETEPGLTQVLPRIEVTERLVLPVAAALVAAPAAPPAAPTPVDCETKPEPVVLRASQRPPATPESHGVLLPPPPATPQPAPSVPPPAVRELAPTGDTPVLGTVVAPALIAEEPRLSVAELAAALATPVPEANDELELELELDVTFSDDERTVVPDDVELILLAEDGAELDRTEPCPSPLAESHLPVPPVETELPDDVLASAPHASAPHASAEPPVAVPESHTVLPPWVAASPEAEELSPPPRVAVPGPRESNVEDLLDRLSSDAVGVDELRSGLKSLAGLEPTPPPPGSFFRD